MALDLRRGILYAPTGSAAFDFYGADRLGDDLFANCLIALNAQTGERIWHFQGVHHDLWDRDFPVRARAPYRKARRKRYRCRRAQPTKQGFVIFLTRANGNPLFPIESRKVSAEHRPWRSRRFRAAFPTRPAPFARQLLTKDLLTTRTPEAHQWALEKFKQFRSEGQFIPFSAGKDTVIFPGFDGGAEWGGPAVDLQTCQIHHYINSNEMAWTGASPRTLAKTARLPLT